MRGSRTTVLSYSRGRVEQGKAAQTAPEGEGEKTGKRERSTRVLVVVEWKGGQPVCEGSKGAPKPSEEGGRR